MNKGKGTHLKKISLHLRYKKRKIKKIHERYAWIYHIFMVQLT